MKIAITILENDERDEYDKNQMIIVPFENQRHGGSEDYVNSSANGKGN